jgi:SAM-dependent methyltransferase
MVFKTIEEVREYIQKDYWEAGQSTNTSNYEKFFIDWDWNERLVTCLNEAFNLQGLRVLDLGCAYGQVVAAMHKHGYDAYGIDISDYAIEQGRKEYEPLKYRIFQGSCHELEPFSKKSFDFIYSNQVFEHIPGDLCTPLAKEIFRVAKPNAILWAGLVLDLAEEHQPQGYNPEDPDKTHINLRPESWWDNIFLNNGWKKDIHSDNKLRAVRLEDDYSFFKDYGWHSICYKVDKDA